MSTQRGAGRILVVDDDETGRDLLREILMRAGHTVEIAASGEAAWSGSTPTGHRSTSSCSTG